ncbi:preprotein translocase subunit SecG [Oleiagrimonas soli]|uniref:Protein-export membrane protein SecG n=1 Tax=Oleiagrimonas soli TaxID=1543381 RepID=A0A099CW24_9GAMM|nr:preprotein translocase subunit SecG [Oleiagrimonas soli]KGI78153.1 preprotein translocase subunit SecG [Oleiagrimonas soli]MBB6183395.1 preprotein translocase subunit SecG [Oleiagrimonas soli]
MFIIFSVFYILIAAAMIVLILMQRGTGADAGAGFGAGASGTVFGARGSASFMTRATGVLATLFFLLSLGMAIYFSHSGAPKQVKNLGVMSAMQTPAASATSTTAPTVPVQTAPPSSVAPRQSGTDVPSLPQEAGSAKPASSASAKK